MLGLVRPLACLPPARDSPSIPRRSPVKLLAAAERGGVTPRSSRSSLETRISLVLALTSQAFSQFQRVSIDLMTETSKYALPRRFEARNLEEALMAVPDLETINYRVVKLTDQYVIREVEPYLIAETTMPGSNGFSYDAASRSFNVLAAYLFGKNTSNDQMKMTTPVYTRKIRTDGMRMDMTTPVITKQSGEKWQMAFVMPSKYGANLPVPIDPSVVINEVPGKTVAVSTFSGFVTDQDVKFRESNLLDALRNDSEFQVKHGTMVEVAQFNPPFTLPFARRNEISLEVERKA